MSRRDRQHARQRIQKRQHEQAQQRQVDSEPDELERERMTARYSREMFGYVRCGEIFYVRHLGVDDRLPSPISRREDRMPDVVRLRREGV